jgi:putative ABC transport system permease protein
MKPLTKKLWRDLWHLRGQVIAIVLVLGSGLATLLMSLGTLHSLEQTLDRIYAESRFADVWLSLVRAPEGRAAAIADWPEVAELQTQIVTRARLTVTGFADPVSALLLSLPDDEPPALNRPFLLKGRLPEPGAAREVALSEAFATAHDLKPGDTVEALIRGKRERLAIVGILLSPEYIYQVQPGGAFPDFKRFAIGFLSRRALEDAAELDGAFNTLSLKLADPAAASRVIARLDAEFGRQGGLGAYPRADQASHKFLAAEFGQLRTLATVFPSVFLGVSAFLLNVVFGRMVAAQRDQIAILKAFGYGPRAIGLHYAGMVGAILLFGNLFGLAGGWVLARLLADMYMVFYRFPYLDFALPLSAVGIGLAVSVLAAGTGATLALVRAARLPPAEAMRPEAPARYVRSWPERLGLGKRLSIVQKMVIRQLQRRPAKSALSVLGIAAAGGVVILGSFQQDALNRMVDQQFALAQRNDIGLSFTEPRGRDALLEIARIPGVVHVEGYRSVPVRLSAGGRSFRTVLEGHPEGARLKRVLVAGERLLTLPPEGLVLSAWLARHLGVGVGDTVEAEQLTGARRRFSLPIVGLAEEYIGVSGYLRIEALNRALGEGERISYALLDLDEAPGGVHGGTRADPVLEQVYAALDRRPQVVGLGERRMAIENFYQTMAESISIFTGIASLLAMGIAFGVLYNTARLSLAERGRELASLRVLGLSPREVASIVSSELILLTAIAIPLGMLLGWALCWVLVQGLQSELYRVPAHLSAVTLTRSALVLMAAAALGVWVVHRRVRTFDLVDVLKTRE